MAEVRCPLCGKSNPETLDFCQFCNARLKLLVAPSPDDQPIRPGEEPVKKSTTEFEKVRRPPEEPIVPGQEPVRKSTGELEQALPAWLRALRGKKEESAPPKPAEPPSDEGLPVAPEIPSAPEPEEKKLPDWLAQFEAETKAEDEEIPKWLASIRGEVSEEMEIPPTEEAPTSEQSADWLSRFEEKPATEPTPPVPTAEPEARLEEATPDWLKRIHEAGAAAPTEEVTPPAFTAEPQAEAGETIPAWMAKLQTEAATRAEEPAAAEPAEAVSDWLAKLKAEAAEAEFAQPTTSEESFPDWLQAHAEEAASAKAEPAAEEPAEAAPAPAVPAEPIPDWLTEVEKTATPSAGLPAFILEKESASSGEEAEAAFSMETPEWLSTLRPEEIEEGEVPAVAPEAEEALETLEPAALPSWVQAMRPVEAIVAETPPAEEYLEGAAEGHGPLAGLRGVLPAGPGLGKIRKPPAYSVKLQVTENQRNYATVLERLVASGTEARPATASSGVLSVSILRWMITLILMLAVGLPILANRQFVPPAAGYPPEMVAARDLVNRLSANAPVLVVFDYEPALSGELEAAAAPLIRELLLKGARLTILSTSPTGPILAERFLQTTQAEHHYQSGQQYINLGYLAGGAAGVLDFAAHPQRAAPETIEGQAAWQLPPLQGIQRLSDFDATIVITENPDTGRIWIEQAGPYLEENPILMVVSAQAEPMIRPYFDSGQVKGLITGLAGGMAYEKAAAHPGLARTYWDAYSAGLFAAVIMMIIGGAWNAVTALQSHHTRHEEEA